MKYARDSVEPTSFYVRCARLYTAHLDEIEAQTVFGTMLLRRAVIGGGSSRAAGASISARGRSVSCGLFQLWQDGVDGSASSGFPPCSVRRRPLSAGVDAHPQPPPPPPPLSTPTPTPHRDARELEFPPPPPTRRGSISASTGGPSSGAGGAADDAGGHAASEAVAATGVTVNTGGNSSIGGGGGGTGGVGVVQDSVDQSFQRVDILESEMNGSNGFGGGGGRGAGITSLDDAWESIGGGSADDGEAEVPSATTSRGARPTEDCVGENGGLSIDGVAAAQLAEAAAAAENYPDKELKEARPGDERAHKMWITQGGAGDSVSESEWEAEGPAGPLGKEDAAVIQFHSQREVDQRRFQGLGVIKEDKAEDIRTLVESFTAPALAAALRDRETALHACAHLLDKGDLTGLRRALLPFTATQVALSRRAMRMRLDLDDPHGFTTTHMYTVRKVLQRLPRHVTTLTEQRASVVIPLCNVDGVASVLFTKRSSTMRAHKNEVCFPGGKVDIGQDQHIIQTALREMGEEIGIRESSVDVLGVLRCDWAEVASLIGVAVTPVVGFLGNLSREQINPNPDEVSHCFTIPIRYLLQQDRWKLEKYKAPAFVGGPYQIWGLTGYILHRLVNDVIRQHLAVN